MLSSYNHYNRNGYQRPTNSEYSVSDAVGHFYLPVYQRIKKPMATRLIIGMINGLGIIAFVWGFFANIEDWKSAVLFVLGALYASAKLIFYIIKSVQDILWRQKHLRKKN